MIATIAEKLANNDDGWFLRFTKARRVVEAFLIEHKSLIGVVLQNLNKTARVIKMRDMFDFLVVEANKGVELTPQSVIKHLGLSTRIYDVAVNPKAADFSDDSKSVIFYRNAIQKEQVCPICEGLLDVGKSVSYDHIVPRREEGLGTPENGQMVHPYCNSAVKA